MFMLNQKQKQLLRLKQLSQQAQAQKQTTNLISLGFVLPKTVTTTKIIVPGLPGSKPKKLTGEDKERRFKKLAYDIFLKRKGKFTKVGIGLPKGLALRRGARLTKQTLSATFKIQQRGITRKKDLPFEPDPTIFRESKIRAGKKIVTPGEFIQRRGKRLGTFGEISSIQKAKRRKRANTFF